MEIKGTAVRSTPDYIKEKYPARYLEWIQSMPPSSKTIFEQPIYATGWYNLTNAVIIPTQKAGDLFFGGNHEKAAWEIGRFSADVALKGIYKIFVRVSSPHFVLSRASSIFAAYYKPSDIKVIESKDKSCVLQLAQFKQDELLIMQRIAGWLAKTLEITQNTVLGIDVNNDVINGELLTRITAKWE